MIYFHLHCNYNLVLESQLPWAFFPPRVLVFVQLPSIYEIIIAMTVENEGVKYKKKKNNKLAWHGIQPLATPHHFSRRCIGGVVLRLQCASASLLFCMLTWRTKRGRRGHVTHTTRGRMEGPEERAYTGDC